MLNTRRSRITLIRMDMELFLNRELKANTRESAASRYTQENASDWRNPPGSGLLGK